MGYVSRRGRAIVVSLILVPTVFFAILISWAVVDDILGSIEVSRFIREHQAIVAERLSNPKVHSFSLSHAPDHSATLLIRFDVDDKATYLMLEDDLDDHWGLRSPAKWKTILRSKEDLGNNFGFAALGMIEIAKAGLHIAVAVVASVTLAGAYLFVALRRLGARQITERQENNVCGSGSSEEWNKFLRNR